MIKNERMTKDMNILLQIKKIGAAAAMAGVLCSPFVGAAETCFAAEEGVIQMAEADTNKIQGRNVGKKCRVHYRGTLNDGTQFDSSYDRGEPIEFICGAGQMIKGFDAAVADMEVGSEKDIHLTPEEAYGPHNPEAVFTVEIAKLPGSETLSAGDRAVLTNSAGQPIPVKVIEKTAETITFDANHEMAGKELNFHIQLVEVL